MLSRRPLLWAAATLAAAAACIPGAYLFVRASEAPQRAWEVFLTARTFALLSNTLGLALTVTVFSAILALPLAWLTVASNLPGRRVWSVILSLPLAVPSFIFGYVLLAAFGTGGLFDGWSLPTPPVYGFWGAVIALTFSTYPFLFLSFRAALLREDPTMLEAAASLGASPLVAFLRVTAPRLVHALRSGGLLVAFYALSDFGAVSLLQYDTFSRAIFMQLEGSFDRSLAALWSLGLMLLSVAVLVLSEFRSDAGLVTRGARASCHVDKPVRLGVWSIPSFALCGFAAGAGIGLPVFVISVWLSRARDNTGAELLLDPTWNSVLASGLAAVATVVGAIPLGLLGARSSSLPARAIVRAAYAGYCLPPIVVALSLVSFGIHALPVLYGTLPMLVFAHVVRFLPQALGPVQGAFMDLSPRLSEAGASLGRGPAAVTLKVVIPLVRPGLLAGTTLVFLTTMKELPATLLLAPIGFQTLSTRVWSEAAEGRFAAGAYPSLVLVLVSALSVAWTLRHERLGSKEAPT